MNESRFYRDVVRQLFYYRQRSSALLKSRSYTVVRTGKIVLAEPIKFATKAAVMAVQNPQKLFRIATGKRSIQSWEKDQKRLRSEYGAWIDDVESKSFSVSAQTKEAAKFSKKPLVSLVTPVFNPPVEAHKKLIDSVLSQTYPHLELLLFNFGDDPAVAKLLEDYAAKDKRVVVRQGLENKGISANSNLCLEFVKGEYVGLLDHDDVLAVNALFECVKAANTIDADFVYSDKDKITEEDERFEAFFKPDWSPEMILGGNYLTHFNLMRTRLVKELGGWDSQTDGAQDWDIFLRILEVSDKVVHVPKVLYSWRTVRTSTASGMGTKPYALAAQKRAVTKHLKHLGVKATCDHDDAGQLYVHWPTEPRPLYIAIHDLGIDAGNTVKIIKDLRARPEFHAGSTIEVFLASGHLPKKERQLIVDTGVTIHDYTIGEFVPTFVKNVPRSKYAKALFISSFLSVKESANLAGWPMQLTGWLNLPGVVLAGGALYAEGGEVADIGSFFDPATTQFHKYHFGGQFRSGYNGYIQWIRNHTLISEQIFAFDTTLLARAEKQLKLTELRDDELAKALALIANNAQERSVYDPTVALYTRAPFEVRLPMSRELAAYVGDNTKLMAGDPYYNPNLNNNYQDPKPGSTSTLPVELFAIGSTEVNL